MNSPLNYGNISWLWFVIAAYGIVALSIMSFAIFSLKQRSQVFKKLTADFLSKK